MKPKNELAPSKQAEDCNETEACVGHNKQAEDRCETDKRIGHNRKEEEMTLSETVQALRETQRQRTCFLKTRIMLQNRLAANVATVLGYHAGMDEKTRTKMIAEASTVIKGISSGEITSLDRPECAVIVPLVIAAEDGIRGFDQAEKAYVKEITRLAKQLPVADWVSQPEQRGFGIFQLGVIIGECGDLNNYESPGKLWKRMGCAPIESHGKMLMPSTWRSQKPGLSADEWAHAGYSPRRRSIAYVISEGLVKQNGTGPYRQRYDYAKLRCQETHPEWKWNDCANCKGAGCDKCYDTGKTCARANNHAMLLCVKLLFKNLCIEWTGSEPIPETDIRFATSPYDPVLV